MPETSTSLVMAQPAEIHNADGAQVSPFEMQTSVEDVQEYR